MHVTDVLQIIRVVLKLMLTNEPSNLVYINMLSLIGMVNSYIEK